MSDETVREVCDEMNGNEFDEPHLNRDGIVGARILAKDLARRILSAYEREMAAKDGEIARLKAALKPVMECNEEACRAFGDHYLMLDNAVRDAQRIMKEGENNG